MSKEIDKGINGLIKRAYLKYCVGYKNPQTYWEKRYSLKLKSDLYQEQQATAEIADCSNRIKQFMEQTGSQSILEIGCGRGKHRNLPGWTGLDFSINALKQSGLKEFIYGDFTKHIPLPDKSFDCVMCQSVLLHVTDEKIGFVASEMCRIARKLVIVSEPKIAGCSGNYSFKHDLNNLFGAVPFEGKVLFA